MIYGYIRVSTKWQLQGNSMEDQKNEILGRYPTAEIVSECYSGAKERTIFLSLLNKQKKGDILVVTKLDRFCRTTKEGLMYIDQLMEQGVCIHILNMGLIEDTPIGRLIVTNLLAFAEFEKAKILERTSSGKAIAKLDPSFKEGRPKKFKKKQLDHALQLLNSHTYSQVEDLTGISKSSLVRAKRNAAGRDCTLKKE